MMNDFFYRRLVTAVGTLAVTILSACVGHSVPTVTTAAPTTAAATVPAETRIPETASAVEKKTVKVAVMCPMSGADAQFFDQYQAAIKTAMTVIEEEDFLKNYDLEFEWIDDKGTDDGALSAADYALDQYVCNVSIGHMLTGMVLAEGQCFEDARTPLLGIISDWDTAASWGEYLCIENRISREDDPMAASGNTDNIEGAAFEAGFIPDPDDALQNRICELYPQNIASGEALTEIAAGVVDAIYHICTALNSMGLQDPSAEDFNWNLNRALHSAAFDGMQGHFDFSQSNNGIGLKNSF